jgi:hypothetical protein
MATERLRVILELEAAQYKREAREAATATGKIGNSAETTSTKTGRLKDKFGELGSTVKLAVGAAAVAVVGNFFRSAVENATKLSESLNAVNQVFGSASDRIVAFGEISAQVVGLSQGDFQQLSISAGGLLQNFGFEADEAAKQAIRLTTRAADMASVFNTDVTDALEAINAGLRGETEPLRRFNVNLSDAAIRAKAVELGLAATTAEVDQHGKAVAALELIYEQSAATQGDFLRTSNDLANAQRRSAASAENASARFGSAFQAPLATLQSGAATILESFTALGAFGGDAAIVAQNSLRVQEAIDGIITAAQDGGDPITALADGLLHIAINGDLTSDTFFALAAGAGLTEDQFEAFNGILQTQGEALGLDEELMTELSDAITGAGDAASDTEGDMSGLTDETYDAAAAAAAAAEAQRALKQQYLESANPIFAAQGALDRLVTAQQKLIDVQEDTKASSEDVALAELELARAALQAQGALDALAEGDVNAGIAAIADALGKSDAEARQLLEALGLIDGKQVTTVVNTRYNTFGREPTTGNLGGQRQHGGPVRAGTSYLVGEVGAELFTPNQDGHITAHDRITTGGATSITENIEVNFNDSRLRDDPLDAVRLALQTRRLSQSVGV